MNHTTRPNGAEEASGESTIRAPAADKRLSAVSSLLDGLEPSASGVGIASSALHAHSATADLRPPGNNDNRLIQVCLGVASCLHTALRAKHAPTANHSLRVALATSSWAVGLGLTECQRDEIEIASLLHDVGKIGVPDEVLQKPSVLTQNEISLMSKHRQIGLEILLSCCASREILEVVNYASAWYDGSRLGYDRSGPDLPLGSRMIAVIDAFDAMTTDQVYRPALPPERALVELFKHSGTQFDPDLVRHFDELDALNKISFHETVARRWLKELEPDLVNSQWGFGTVIPLVAHQGLESLFNEKLFNSMQDGVVFVDANLQIIRWNASAERLTNIPASSVIQKQWLPSLVGMRNELQKAIPDEDCPVAHAIRMGIQSTRRLTVACRSGQYFAVEVNVMPVVACDGTTQGATIVLRDKSSETDLEERVQSLHIRATRDPLTKIHNRAEFDRTHTYFVHEHLNHSQPCSLIIADIDHFKQVNDTFGHQAGDKALVNFAAHLQRLCRQGDLVARYGGEEFVMLCADCDNATAASRAEQIRRELAEIPQPALQGKRLTASFGVTEVQIGDTPETMLRRADRAVYKAKEMGRNTVVQLGSGIHGEKATERNWWSSWLQRTPPDLLLERNLVTPVSLKIALEKLRGFVADHGAEIVSVDEEQIVMSFDGRSASTMRRAGDRNVSFLIELKFTEKLLDSESNAERYESAMRTTVHVTIRPKRNRDRRRRDAVERSRQALSSLKSYLMAHEESVHDKKQEAKSKKKAKRAWRSQSPKAG